MKCTGRNFNCFFTQITNIKIINFVFVKILQVNFIIIFHIRIIKCACIIKCRHNIIYIFRDAIFPFSSFCFPSSLIKKCRKITAVPTFPYMLFKPPRENALCINKCFISVAYFKDPVKAGYSINLKFYLVCFPSRYSFNIRNFHYSYTGGYKSIFYIEC